MTGMFNGCAAFNQSVSNFDTAAVKNMVYMFNGCAAFNQSVSNFDTAAVENMPGMFQDCAAFNQSVSNFDTAAVTSMAFMFKGCAAFNQSVSNFDTAAVENMAFMFQGCAAFDYDISHFSVRKLVTTTANTGLDYFMASANSFSTANLDKLLKAWDAAKAGNAGNNHRPTFATSCSGAGGGVAARDNLQTAGWSFTMPADLP
jgi:surface protein